MSRNLRDTTLAGVQDVLIYRHEVTKGSRRIDERIREFDRDHEPSESEIEEICSEVFSDPTAGEVAEVWYRKIVLLSDNFHFSLAEHPENETFAGFGFNAGFGSHVHAVDRPPTFSWEWFSVQRPGRAKKLQEAGTILFEQGDTACGREIVRMTFETDVSFRIFAGGNQDLSEPYWRINIHQGSEIF